MIVLYLTKILFRLTVQMTNDNNKWRMKTKRLLTTVQCSRMTARQSSSSECVSDNTNMPCYFKLSSSLVGTHFIIRNLINLFRCNVINLFNSVLSSALAQQRWVANYIWRLHIFAICLINLYGWSIFMLSNVGKFVWLPNICY